ncbi:hypothetical protein PV416_06155 [Streptomyces ipomoeae]|uniref:Calcium-binding protein n=1 Tax=Streptomyces ipomoeae 91-03 TaxID=698759 RepID=L1L348_9ACTN|nr:hypothetical protein [Streptomyces ipomoeae]EKX67219.1 hypothetical protein STRIP9103_06620 [Streptomyces ipomoeae 91-03]MDX2693280.1 hypothetical protein [Streptomyces ipomoeae]MDX2820680.1 hypothetical protein [Streptomyces ipomoeae]MDX2838763.1 hypothetical protein [Streptomyces ipomoeae]MDX2873187.1 hypothetical protein [Streptomyces ipomoeae]
MRHRTRPAHNRTLAVAGGAAALVLLAATGAHAEGRGDVRVTKTVVNGGRNVIVGTSKTVTFPIAVTIKDDSGVKGLTRVSTFNTHNAGSFFDWTGTKCVKKSRTTSVCTATMTVDPGWIPQSTEGDTNAAAGVWQVNATVKANDGDYWISDRIALYKVKRASALTAFIKPEKVAKGAKVTVTGKLTRANWETLKYNGFTKQSVQLQFKKKGATRYTTVKTVKTGSAGKIGTKVTVTSAGTWRWYFPGTTTTARVTSAGDAVTLK